MVHSAESFTREQNKTTTTKTKKSKYFLILTLSNLCIMKSVLSSPHKIISHDTMTIYISFFYQGFLSRTLTTHSRGREDTILPLPPAHEHSDNYLQLCTWDDYHIFLIASPVFTRLLCYSMRFTTVSNYYLIDVMLTFVLFACWFDFRFCYGDLTWETSGTRTCIDYHPCITSEPTNQVC